MPGHWYSVQICREHRDLRHELRTLVDNSYRHIRRLPHSVRV